MFALQVVQNCLLAAAVYNGCWDMTATRGVSEIKQVDRLGTLVSPCPFVVVSNRWLGIEHMMYYGRESYYVWWPGGKKEIVRRYVTEPAEY